MENRATLRLGCASRIGIGASGIGIAHRTRGTGADLGLTTGARQARGSARAERKKKKRTAQMCGSTYFLKVQLVCGVKETKNALVESDAAPRPCDVMIYVDFYCELAIY